MEKTTVNILPEAAREFIVNYAECFVNQIRFMVYEKAVIMYVETLKSELDYALCIGIFDNPNSAMTAALNSEEYQRHLSARQRLANAIDKDPEWKKNEDYLQAHMPPKGSSTASTAIVKERCEAAIRYYHETDKTNRRVSL